MELYICGFNTHHQLVHDEISHSDEIVQFRRVLRSPRLNVRCALWSSTVIESDGTLIHQGYRSSGLDPTLIDGPPTRNIKSIFGDTSGVLGALATDGSLYLYHDGSELKRHRFPKDSFIVRQSLALEHLAIADNGVVCICTSASLPHIHQRLLPPVDHSHQTARLERGVPKETRPRRQKRRPGFSSPRLPPRSRSTYSHPSRASCPVTPQQPPTSSQRL